MIQDIAPHRLNNQYDPKVNPEPEDYVINTMKNLMQSRIGPLHEVYLSVICLFIRFQRIRILPL